MKNKKRIYENPILYLIIFIIGIGTVLMYSASSTVGINKFNHYAFYLNKHLFNVFVSFYVYSMFQIINTNILIINC